MWYFFWLGNQAFSGLLYAWPISSLLITLLVPAMIADTFRKKFSANARAFTLLLPLIGTFLILAAGTIFEKTEKWFFLPYVGFAVCLALAVFAVARTRKMWITGAAVSLCFLWYSLWCVFVSVMSITGDWL